MIKNVIEYLICTSAKYPNKVALSDSKGNMTFKELDDMAKKIAMEIVKRTGGKVNNPIAVMMSKNKECIAAFMGVVYSGNYYCPIDLSMPQARVDIIMEQLAPILIISEDNFIYDNSVAYNSCLNNEIDEFVIKQQIGKVINVDPIYVLFTSGSTGIPKGVVVTHAGVIDYIEWLEEKFNFNENTVFGNQAPLYFDNSILDIYSCLKNGATVCFIEKKMFAFPHQLLSYMNEKQINTIFWVPSALIGVADSGALRTEIALPNLDNILFCGEVMPTKQLRKWMTAFPTARFVNMYGPTEITDVCTYFIVDRLYGDDELLPIGKACENTDVLIINEEQKQANTNEIGEIIVRGIGVSKGYYKNEEKSNLSFVQNPLQNNYIDIVYKTGDIGKVDENGNIIYIGRKDNQIKYQGHRIELGEIESCAISFDGIKRACAVFLEKKNKIVLYVTIHEHTVFNKIEIYKYMKTKIPKYMLPTEIEILEAMPLNANGKIDRAKLKEDADGANNIRNNTEN